MPVKEADVEMEYAKNKDLKREDVLMLREWVEKQPHLPEMTEMQLILFLHACHYRNEAAKATIDKYFTVKYLFPEMFSNRDPRTKAAEAYMRNNLIAALPKLTPEGYRVFYFRLMDTNPDNYVFTEQLKQADMFCTLWMCQNGTDKGHVFVLDHAGLSLGHLTKFGLMAMKKYMYYLQEATPIRLKAFHTINVVPFIDKLMAIIRPFIKKELMDLLHMHQGVEPVFKYVPQECMPNEYGGTAGTFAELHEKQKRYLLDNAEFFVEAEKQVAEESKRASKPKDIDQIFGIEGTFKKLEID